MRGAATWGPRPIDQHLKAFSALGAQDSVDYGMITVRAKEKLQGARIFFDKVSVGATMNAMLSAVMAEGQTVLENCAKEPPCGGPGQLFEYVRRGRPGRRHRRHQGAGRHRHARLHLQLIPDQIEAGTYMVAAAAPAATS